MRKCVGLKGWLLGHRFILCGIPVPYCLRCGYPAGANESAVGPTTPQTFRITKGQRQYLAETVKRDRRRGPTT